MVIRKLIPQEYREADILDSLSFAFPLPADADAPQDENPYLPDRWGCFDEAGKMTATLTNHKLPFYFDGGIAPATGVGGVASDPISRGQGNVRALMEHILKADRADGQLFSALYPFSHKFYDKFGYAVCYEHRRACFPLGALSLFQSEDPPQVRLLRPEDGTASLHPLYEAFAKPYNMMIARDTQTWKLFKLMAAEKAKRYCYVLSRDGQDVAFGSFTFRQGETMFRQTLCMDQYGFADEQGFRDLLGFLYRYTAFAQDAEVLIPEELPISAMLAKADDVQYKFAGKPMARALHVENILKAMRHPAANGTYAIAVSDPLLAENDGCFQVSYTADGTVSVSRSTRQADLHVTVQTFAQLALGYVSLDSAAYKPGVTIAGNADTLQQVFVYKRKGLMNFY